MTSLWQQLAKFSFTPAFLLAILCFSHAAHAQQTSEGSGVPSSSIWTKLKTPNLGASNVLLSLSADSPDDIWSVGDFVSLRFNGTTWTDFPLAALQIQGPSEATMSGITAVSPSDVWAVGLTLEETESGSSHLISMIEQFNGTKWSIASSPQFADGAQLNAVQAISATNIYAAGGSNADNQKPNPLLEHYDGTNWSVVTLPELGQGQTGMLRGIAVISDSDIWLLGDSGTVVPTQTIAMHFDGITWSIVPVPLPAGVKFITFGEGPAAIATNNVWAVGTYQPRDATSERTLTEHWDGTVWSIVASPNAGSSGSANRLTGVSAVSSNDVWASGQTDNPGLGFANLIEHWDGTKWSISPVAQGNGFAGLNAMLAFPSGIVYAAGSDLGSDSRLISVVFETRQGK